MRILWFGLGRFGRPMAENLLDRGHVLVLPRNSHGVRATAELVRRGAVAPEPDTAVDVCGLCLPTPEDVDGALATTHTAAVSSVVDFSTGNPTAARRLAADLARRGVRYVDAPVSGSIETARTGDLTVWVGAAAQDVDDDAGTLISDAATHVWHMGSVGAGAAMKLTNQIIHIENVAAIGEGLRFAVAQGLDPVVAVRSMVTSSADSAMLRRVGPTIAAGTYEPRFALRLALKDLRYAEVEARDAGLHLDNLARLRARLERLAADGFADGDFTLLADPATDP